MSRLWVNTWPEEPRDQHVLSCSVWTSNELCDCDQVRNPVLPRMTVAERLDLLYPCDTDEEAS